MTRCLLSGLRFDNFHHSCLGFHCLLYRLAIIPSSQTITIIAPLTYIMHVIILIKFPL